MSVIPPVPIPDWVIVLSGWAAVTPSPIDDTLIALIAMGHATSGILSGLFTGTLPGATAVGRQLPSNIQAVFVEPSFSRIIPNSVLLAHSLIRDISQVNPAEDGAYTAIDVLRTTSSLAGMSMGIDVPTSQLSLSGVDVYQRSQDLVQTELPTPLITDVQFYTPPKTVLEPDIQFSQTVQQSQVFTPVSIICPPNICEPSAFPTAREMLRNGKIAFAMIAAAIAAGFDFKLLEEES